MHQTVEKTPMQTGLTMEDMLRYLDQDFPAAPEGKLRIVATRHGDGTRAGKTSHEYHRQRAQLFHGLDAVAAVQVDSDADAKDPRETGSVYLDIATLVANIVTPMLVAWISSRPRKEKSSVPGIVLVRSDGARLTISHRTPEAERAKLIDDFLRGASGPPVAS
jgi:hypothetical protein